MFLLRYCAESAKDPLLCPDTSIDTMNKPLSSHFLREIQRPHYNSEAVRKLREAYEKESIRRNGAAHQPDETNDCFEGESISELSPSSMTSSYDDTTAEGRSHDQRSLTREHSSSSEFSAPNEFLYSSMQTDAEDSSNSRSLLSTGSSFQNSLSGRVEESMDSSRAENDRLHRRRKKYAIVRNPRSLLPTMKQSLDYSSSYDGEGGSESSSYRGYDVRAPIKEENDITAISEEHDSYSSQSSCDKNYTKHLYPGARDGPPAIPRTLDGGLSKAEHTAKNLNEAFCASMAEEDGSMREEEERSTIDPNLSSFDEANKSCLLSFGRSSRNSKVVQHLLEPDEPKQAAIATKKVERHISLPSTPSPHKSSKELITEYLRAREAGKFVVGKANSSGLQKSPGTSDRIQSSTPRAASITPPHVEHSTKPSVPLNQPTAKNASSPSSRSQMISDYLRKRDSKSPRNPILAHPASDQGSTKYYSKPEPANLGENSDIANLYKYKFSRPESPECSIDYYNVITEYLQQKGTVPSPEQTPRGKWAGRDLVQSMERVDVSGLSNPTYLVSPERFDCFDRATNSAAIFGSHGSRSTSHDTRQQRDTGNTFEFDSPSSLKSESLVHKQDDASGEVDEASLAFSERALEVEELGHRLAALGERRLEIDDDDTYDTAARNVYKGYSKSCFTHLDRLVCSKHRHPTTTAKGYAILVDKTPPRFQGGHIVTPRTDMVPSPFGSSASPGLEDCHGIQLEI